MRNPETGPEDPIKQSDSIHSPDSSVESPLVQINGIESGKPASFFAYHGSDRPFVSAIPSEKYPVVFYSETPEIAATYPFGKSLNESIQRETDIESNNPEYTREELIIGAKLLLMEDQGNSPLPGPKKRDLRRLQEYHMKEPEVISTQEKLKSDPIFRRECEKVFLAWENTIALGSLAKEEVADFETGPLGSVRQYLIEAKSPFIFDFEGHTWGDLPYKDGGWTRPTRRATTKDLRPLWDEWLNNFFQKGYDVLIIKNIRDVGTNFVGEIAEPHTIIAVSAKAKVGIQSPLIK